MNLENEFRKEVIECLFDRSDISDFPDEKELFYLWKIAKKLNITRENARKIIDNTFITFEKECDISLHHDIQDKLTKKNWLATLKKNLQIYSKYRNLQSLQISEVFYVGRNKNLIFKITGTTYENNFISYILKYDFFPKLYKEFLKFHKNNSLLTAVVYPECEIFKCISKDNYGFLELKLVGDTANSIELLSVDTILDDLENYSKDISYREYLIGAIKNIIHFLFHQVYHPFIKRDYYSNGINHFLPAQETYNGILSLEYQMKSNNLQLINKSDIVDYDIDTNFNKNKIDITFKLFMTEKPNDLKNRIDILSSIHHKDIYRFMKYPSWYLYQDQHFFNNHNRDEYLDGIQTFLKDSLNTISFEKYKISDIFKKTNGKKYLDILLQKKGFIFYSDSINGNLSTKHILIGKIEHLDHFTLSPMITNFYESSMTGNLFYDMASIELEMIIKILQNHFKKNKIEENSQSFSMESLQIILDFEERIFKFEQTQSLFKEDFIIFSFRTSLQEQANDIFQKSYFSDWYKNYILCQAIYALQFFQQARTNLEKTIAVLWSLRCFYRFENFASQIYNMSTNAPIEMRRFKSQLENLITNCRKASREVKEYLLIDDIPQNLFFNYFSFEEDRLNYFLSHENRNNKNCLLLCAERGMGKSTFLDNFFFNSENSYPILYLSGIEPIQSTKYHFEKLIKKNLGENYRNRDWLFQIQHQMESENQLFCIIIEDIYYNPEPKKAARALTEFIQRITYSHFKIKIIVTTNYTFYDLYLQQEKDLKTFLHSIFYKKSKKPFLELSKPTENIREKMIKAYFNHYAITEKISEYKKSLFWRPGFLKKFCELKSLLKSNTSNANNYIFPFLFHTFIHQQISKIEKSIELPAKKIYEVFSTLSQWIWNSGFLYFSEEDFFKVLNDIDIDRNKTYPMLYFSIKNNVFVRCQNSLRFRFIEIPCYLIASDIIKNIDLDSKKSGEKFKNLMQTIQDHMISEITGSYILCLAYNRDQEGRLFTEILELMKSFHETLYIVIRIFAKFIICLPHQNLQIIKFINNFKEEIKYELAISKNPLLKKSYEYGFDLLDNNLIYDDRAIKYIRLFEKPIQEKNSQQILKIFLESNNDFEWNDFSIFLKRDLQKNANFIRNYIIPSWQLFSRANDINDIALLYMSQNLLTLLKKHGSKLHDLEFHILNLLFRFMDPDELDIKQIFRDRACDIFLNYNIMDLSLFDTIANQVYLLDKKIPEKNLWLRFLLNYSNMDMHLHLIAHEHLIRLIPDINYESLDSNTRTELRNYITHGPIEFMISLVKPLLPSIKKESERQIYSNYLKNNSQWNNTTQRVVSIILKDKNSLLLRYNENWQDYNWIGGQVDIYTEDEDEYLDFACEIMQKKLGLASDEYIIKKFTKKPIEYEKFSKSRGKYITYITFLYIAFIKEDYILKEIEADQKIKAFSWQELTRPVNTHVSSAVRSIVFKINQNEELLNYWNHLKNLNL